jgi:hypothetical protein
MVHKVKSVMMPPFTWSASLGVNSFAPWRASTLLSLFMCFFLSYQPSLKLAHRVAIFPANGIPGAYRQSVDVAADMLNFRRRQLACVLATQDPIVIVHVFLLSFQPSLELAPRVAVVGSGCGTRGTDGQSVDAAVNVVNFRRCELACVLATQDSVIFVHSISFLS